MTTTNEHQKEDNDTNTVTLLKPAIPISPLPLQQQQPIHNYHSDDHSDSSCSSCLYTGVITCLGLSVYFAHIALEEDANTSIVNTKTPATTPTLSSTHQMNPAKHTTNAITTSTSSNVIRNWFQQQQQMFTKFTFPPPQSPSSARYNKPVFLCISAGWFVVGLYRWQLG